MEKKVRERPHYTFYKYENNPNGSEYCFCQRPCDDNMSLLCFLKNGEILGFASQSIVYGHPSIQEVDLKEVMHNFIQPIMKERNSLRKALDEINKELENLK